MLQAMRGVLAGLAQEHLWGRSLRHTGSKALGISDFVNVQLHESTVDMIEPIKSTIAILVLGPQIDNIGKRSERNIQRRG